MGSSACQEERGLCIADVIKGIKLGKKNIKSWDPFSLATAAIRGQALCSQSPTKMILYLSQTRLLMMLLMHPLLFCCLFPHSQAPFPLSVTDPFAFDGDRIIFEYVKVLL